MYVARHHLLIQSVIQSSEHWELEELCVYNSLRCHSVLVTSSRSVFVSSYFCSNCCHRLVLILPLPLDACASSSLLFPLALSLEWCKLPFYPLLVYSSAQTGRLHCLLNGERDDEHGDGDEVSLTTLPLQSMARVKSTYTWEEMNSKVQLVTRSGREGTMALSSNQVNCHSIDEFSLSLLLLLSLSFSLSPPG